MAGNTGDHRNAVAMNDRRTVILSAASELLSEYGLEGLTIRAVLTRTALARRAFYDLFPTKDDLILALFEHTINEAVRHLATQTEQLATPAERLALVIKQIAAPVVPDVPGRGSLRSDRRSAAFSQEHLRLAHVRPQQLRDTVYPLIALIKQLILQGVKVHGWDCADPERYAHFVYNLVSTTVQTEFVLQEAGPAASDERASLPEQLIHFCLHGLAQG